MYVLFLQEPEHGDSGSWTLNWEVDRKFFLQQEWFISDRNVPCNVMRSDTVFLLGHRVVCLDNDPQRNWFEKWHESIKTQCLSFPQYLGGNESKAGFAKKPVGGNEIGLEVRT